MGLRGPKQKTDVQKLATKIVAGDMARRPNPGRSDAGSSVPEPRMREAGAS
jgi:hypothetical protein